MSQHNPRLSANFVASRNAIMRLVCPRSYPFSAFPNPIITSPTAFGNFLTGRGPRAATCKAFTYNPDTTALPEPLSHVCHQKLLLQKRLRLCSCFCDGGAEYSLRRLLRFDLQMCRSTIVIHAYQSSSEFLSRWMSHRGFLTTLVLVVDHPGRWRSKKVFM